MTKVSVCMITYNHEPYIEQAIHGVLSQNFDFDVELVISDDASNDKTHEKIIAIINKNESKVKIRYFRNIENIGMINNFIQAISKCKGQYIALCEGDDYWTDFNKIKTQTSILDRQSEISGVATNCDFVDAKNNKLGKFGLYEDKLFDTKSLLGERFFHTATLIFRACNFPNDYPDNILSGDRLLYILLSLKGDILCLGASTAVYRKHTSGLSSNVTSTQLMRDLNMINYLNSKLDKSIIHKLKAYIYSTIIDYSKTISFKDFTILSFKFLRLRICGFFSDNDPQFNYLDKKMLIKAFRKLNLS